MTKFLVMPLMLLALSGTAQTANSKSTPPDHKTGTATQATTAPIATGNPVSASTEDAKDLKILYLEGQLEALQHENNNCTAKLLQANEASVKSSFDLTIQSYSVKEAELRKKLNVPANYVLDPATGQFNPSQKVK